MNGYDHKGLAIIAGYSKPAGKDQIEKHLSDALKDLGLKENEKTDEYESLALYHVSMIIKKINIRKHLKNLYDIYISSDDPRYTIFFLLHHAWEDLEDEYVQKEFNGIQFYYEGATTDNIESLVIKESENWAKEIIN
ncbi:MAG: hypothetical protein R2773_00725 [Flavobacteriaceae bacterium]